MDALCVFGRGIEQAKMRHGFVWRPTRYIEVLTERGWHTGFRSDRLNAGDERSVVAGANANAIAAATVFLEAQRVGHPPRVVMFAAGRPGYISDHPDITLSEGRVLKARFLRIVHPPEQTEVIIQDANRNTRDDLLQSLDVVDSRGLRDITIITVELHIPRSKEFLKLALQRNPALAAVAVTFAAAEEILIGRHGMYGKTFRSVRGSAAWRRTKIMEDAGIAALQSGSYRFQDEGYEFSKP